MWPLLRLQRIESSLVSAAVHKRREQGSASAAASLICRPTPAEEVEMTTGRPTLAKHVAPPRSP